MTDYDELMEILLEYIQRYGLSEKARAFFVRTSERTAGVSEEQAR